MNNYHLVKTEGEWRLREEGSGEEVYTAETKEAALEKLGDYMEDREGNVVVHKVDGAIQEHRVYGRDEEDDDRGLSRRAWSIIGLVTASAVTLASLAYVFRDRIPTDRLSDRLPDRLKIR